MRRRFKVQPPRLLVDVFGDGAIWVTRRTAREMRSRGVDGWRLKVETSSSFGRTQDVWTDVTDEVRSFEIHRGPSA